MQGTRVRRAGVALAVSGCVTATVVTGLGATAQAVGRTTLSAGASRPRACFAARVAGAGVDGFAVSSTVNGFVRVRLAPVDANAVAADWDVAVYDEGTGRLLGASTAPRSYEVADGRVTKGERLWVQGCRYAGRAASVRVSTTFVAAPTSSASSSSSSDRSTAAATDVTTRRDLELPLRPAATASSSATQADLPSGRTTYRHLWDYDYELKELARLHPDLARSITLPERSYEGRDISGLEITAHVGRSDDGKPVFLNAGLIHAREWPAGELPMEWAYDLVTGYGHDRRTTRLLRTARTIVVPVVNPDGFAESREDPRETGSDPLGLADRRKSCDPAGAPADSGQSNFCAAGARDLGVDLNRNFGAFWGGPGASTDFSDETYRGTAPFSEPESRALRDLVSTRQVTNMIMNHTAAGAVLRPPGVYAEGTPVDEPLLKRLGQRLADHDGYPSIPIYGLTDATGGSDEWAYWVGGTLAYTIEIGTPGFHPAFANVVAEYLGRSPAEGAGLGGNRASYFAMLAATASARDHAVLTGRAPKGWTLQLRKTFTTPTSPVQRPDGSAGKPILVRDTFVSRLASTGGRFRWAVNPSTRPYVAGRYGREPLAPVQEPTTLVNPPGVPPLDDGTGTAGPHEEATFTVEKPPQADVGAATVTVAWHSPDTFWLADIERPDGSYVAQTQTSDATSETITLNDPEPGPYVVKVVREPQPDGTPFDDWSGQVTYAGPTPAVPGTTEAWTLTCRRPDGSTAATRAVVVKRGQRLDVGRVCRA